VTLRFSIDDVATMLRAGILPEDSSTELLDGMIVLKDRANKGEPTDVHGKRHAAGVALLADLANRINAPACHVRSQLPLACDQYNAPEPDFAIVRGNARDYLERFPSGTDVSCVAEVADSSLERDSERKLSIYARAGVGQCLIINLRNDTLEHYSEPDPQAATFRTKITLSLGQTIAIQLVNGDVLQTAVADLLP
jgi:Uma2 family endonuclease